jgi:hypothetical protein
MSSASAGSQIPDGARHQNARAQSFLRNTLSCFEQSLDRAAQFLREPVEVFGEARSVRLRISR